MDNVGTRAGAEKVTLTLKHLPSHMHALTDYDGVARNRGLGGFILEPCTGTSCAAPVRVPSPNSRARCSLAEAHPCVVNPPFCPPVLYVSLLGVLA